MAKNTRDYTKKNRPKRRQANVRKGKANVRRGAAVQPSPIRLWAFSTVLMLGLIAGITYVLMLDKHAFQSPKKSQVSIRHHKKRPIHHAQSQSQKHTKPRFEFYNILPKSSVQTQTLETLKAKQTHHYTVHVISTKNPKEAEKLRARLILQGLAPHINQAKAKHGTWYRVTFGPYTSRTDAEQTLKQLRQNNMDGLIHRLN